MMAQYALQVLQNVVIDDFEIWTRDIKNKNKNYFSKITYMISREYFFVI
jgi:hypothetical protein